jgi:hypothetical protein
MSQAVSAGCTRALVDVVPVIDLRDADKRLQDTADYLDEAIQINRNPSPTPSMQECVRLAARAYRLAVARVTGLSRLNCFTMGQVVPEAPKLRRPRKAQSTRSMSLRQTAGLLLKGKETSETAA